MPLPIVVRYRFVSDWDAFGRQGAYQRHSFLGLAFDLAAGAAGGVIETGAAPALALVTDTGLGLDCGGSAARVLAQLDTAKASRRMRASCFMLAP